MSEAYPGAAVMDRIEATFMEMARDVNFASGAARNAWMFFMALHAYFFIALAGITHRDLLLSTAVSLPLLDVDVGLRPFFLFGPLILVLIHFGILLQHAMLARKIHELHDRVTRFEGQGGFRTHRVRIQLHSYFYTQLIAGPYRSRLFAAFLSLMTWLTLVIFPVLLLLDFQVTFLPFHDLATTWAHRVYLVLDLAVMAIFGIYMRYPSKSFVSGFGANMAQRPLSFMASGLFCMAAIAFSYAVATVPDETMDRVMAAIPATRTPVPVGESSGRKPRAAFWPTAMLFEGNVDHLSGRPASLFGRNLVVTDADLVRDADFTSGETSISLRRRDLRYGAFDRSDMHQADLTGVIADGASFRETNLKGFKGERAELPNTDFWRALLTNQTLNGQAVRESQMRRVNMRNASLGEANLRFIDLEGAAFEGADLRGAILDGANLTGASFAGADLRGAKIDQKNAAEAQRQGAQF